MQQPNTGYNPYLTQQSQQLQQPYVAQAQQPYDLYRDIAQGTPNQGCFPSKASGFAQQVC
jgi:hypothetical protein